MRRAAFRVGILRRGKILIASDSEQNLALNMKYTAVRVYLTRITTTPKAQLNTEGTIGNAFGVNLAAALHLHGCRALLSGVGGFRDDVYNRIGIRHKRHVTGFNLTSRCLHPLRKHALQ